MRLGGYTFKTDTIGPFGRTMRRPGFLAQAAPPGSNDPVVRDGGDNGPPPGGGNRTCPPCSCGVHPFWPIATGVGVTLFIGSLFS